MLWFNPDYVIAETITHAKWQVFCLVKSLFLQKVVTPFCRDLVTGIQVMLFAERYRPCMPGAWHWHCCLQPNRARLFDWQVQDAGRSCL